MLRSIAVALCALLFTHAFFVEYRPGKLRRMEIPYDLQGYHFPIEDYAFQSLRDGRFPEWDPTIYSGLPFAANVQAALFYPPHWLLFAANAGRSKMSYQSLEDFVLAHVWFAFLLCYLWLRSRRLHPLAAALGGGVFAYSGYMMTQLQHMGVVCGYTWVPLGLWGIDQAYEEKRWRPMWKVAVASAMCLLAGYTPLWPVFGLIMLAYAAGRRSPWRVLAGTAASLAFSVLLSAVQLLAAMETSGAMVREARYGIGIRDPLFYISYLVPNFHDYGMNVPVTTAPGFEYLYLGGAGIVGVVLALFFRRGLAAGFVLAFGCLFLMNPFGILQPFLSSPNLVSQVIRDWQFLAALATAAAALAALGLDAWISREGKPVPSWIAWAAVAAAIAWCVRLIYTWSPGGPEFAAQWQSAYDGAAGIAIGGALVWLFGATGQRTRMAVGAALLVLTAAEFKAYGTSKRFNASIIVEGPASAKEPLPLVDASVWREMVSHPEYRVGLDYATCWPTDLRHSRLTTPQGIDPLIPTQYRRLVEQFGQFRTDREFDVDPFNPRMMQLFGVRYFISHDGTQFAPGLKESGRFRLMEPLRDYLKVYEYKDARPAYGWESGSGDVRVQRWSAEHRAFDIRAHEPSRFRLSEQMFPGWSATLDSASAQIERCQEAYQCVGVPAGEHRVEFTYKSRPLRMGALISLLSAAALLVGVFYSRPSSSSSR